MAELGHTQGDVTPEPVTFMPCSPTIARMVINTEGQMGTLEAVGTDWGVGSNTGKTRDDLL